MSNESIRFNCPEKYQDRLFLFPTDIQEIFEIGESLCYAYLKNPPFRTEKVGTKIMIFANSFWDWYNYDK